MIGFLSRDELLELLYCYDKYIQFANEENSYKDEWYPVCIEEFYQNDLEEWKKLEENQDIEKSS